MLLEKEKELQEEKDAYIGKRPNENILKTHSAISKLNPQSLKKLEDYTEIIPQKIENKQTNLISEKIITNIINDNEKLEENCDNQNLDFFLLVKIFKKTIQRIISLIQKKLKLTTPTILIILIILIIFIS